MEYTISKFARLAGVSTRTLRYYDEIDLLKPHRENTNGYRIYGEKEVDLLQQILFYREMELSLEEIKQIIHGDNFDIEKALKAQHVHLLHEKNRLEQLIQTVEKSIQSHKGEKQMADKEKFEAFKKEKLRQNETQYGEEIREKYGNQAVEKSNEKWSEMTRKDYNQLEELTARLNADLAEATRESSPESEQGQAVAGLHQQWIMQAWPNDYYTKSKHYNLSVMYLEDPRFRAYYEKIAPGAAEFLNQALKIYLQVEE